MGSGPAHPGVVSLLLMDGSVRVIKSSINVQTCWGPGTMATGEVSGADAS
jgi:hypothetical protein